MNCNICYEILENEIYCLIIHNNETKNDALKRGHYFHKKCLSKCKTQKCPFDREKCNHLIMNPNIQSQELININDYYDYAKIKFPKSIKDVKFDYSDINKQDIYGRTILYYACDQNNYKMVKHLLNKKADIRISNYDGFTPLMKICSNGSKYAQKILKLFLESEYIHEIINKKDKSNITAFEYAQQRNNLEIIKMLTQYYINKNIL